MTTMLRVNEQTRDRVMRVAAEDFHGVTADEALNRLLDEHWETMAIAAMDHFRATDPATWTEYVAQAGAWDETGAPIVDEWNEQIS